MTAKDDFNAYKRWEKYILATHPELPDRCRRTTLIAYCLAMAIKGRNGLGCFASDETIGKEIGIANREVVSRYRRLAIDLGWFTWNGKRRGRAKLLDVSIPAVTEMSTKVDIPAEDKPADDPRDNPAHDAWVDPSSDEELRYCLGCEPLLGSHTLDEVRVIHLDAVMPA
jgi:hypothetical protein